MQPSKNPASSIALRVATAMHQMGIEGLPRNYELVYEAYAGGNPDLVREFISLGKVKPQEALDALGRKYLPHHHEEGLLSRQNRLVRAEMSNFINMLNEEKISLTDYGRLIGDASRAFRGDGDVDHAELGHSIRVLKQATELRSNQNSTAVRAVVNQTVALADMQREADAADNAKFVDALTGLGSRRSINRALAKVYVSPGMPVLCGLAIGEIDDYARLAEQMGPASAERFLKQVAKVVQTVVKDEDIACRFDGGRFGLLFYTSEVDEIGRLIDLIRARLKATVVNGGSGQTLGQVPMSFGVCLSDKAPNAFDLMTFSERALATSKAAGGNTVTVYGLADPAFAPKDWLIYQREAR